MNGFFQHPAGPPSRLTEPVASVKMGLAMAQRDDNDGERIRLTMHDLQDSAAAQADGLSAVYLPGEGFKLVEPDSAEAAEFLPKGSQKVTSLSEDLMLARSDMRDVPESAHQQQWDLDFRGWLFLHFRLEGLSRETLPDGTTRTVGGQSFLLSASRGHPYGSRKVLGDSWRTVGIACRPSFVARELKISSDSLPRGLQRFQDGDPDVEFWFASEMTHEMTAVAGALLQPTVHKSVRPIYLRAKAVELVCLAVDRLRQPEQLGESAIRLSKYDITCMHFAREILDESRRAPTLDELARRVGVNRNKLAVGFKHVFGMTVGAYHRDRRLERAYDMLRNPDISIGRVADEAGYRDAGSFTKAFKNRYGVLPSELRP